MAYVCMPEMEVSQMPNINAHKQTSLPRPHSLKKYRLLCSSPPRLLFPSKSVVLWKVGSERGLAPSPA